MKKLFHLIQWAVLIAFCILGIRYLTRPIAPPLYQPEAWSSWQGFQVLSYAGISRDRHPDYVSPRLLAEHLEALAAAGYQTIFPEDALAFLEGRHPLPENALLLMFEGGRKNSYINAAPILRRLGMVATVFVPTTVTRRWGNFYLRSSDLKKVVADPHWHLASMGHRAIETLPDPAGGEAGHYLTRRQKIKGGPESDEVYQARVTADFVEANRRLSKAGITNRTAYLFPYGDAGTAAEADPLAARIIAEVLPLYHDLAFTRADDPFNGAASEPLYLTRLRVPGNWDAATLLDQLEKAQPRWEPVAALGGPEHWIFAGAGDCTGQVLRLDPGAQAWLRGSGCWTDSELELTLTRQPGAEASLYLRYAGPHRYLRLHVNDEGLRLQERLGRTLQTLFTRAHPPAHGPAYQLALRLRGNRVWLYEQGQLLAGPLPLTRFTASGRTGLEAGGAALEVTQFSARPGLGAVALSASYRALPAPAQKGISLLIVPWLTAAAPPALSDAQRHDLLLAASDGLTVVPLIEVSSALSIEQAVAYADGLVQALDHDITRPLITRLALRGGDDHLAWALRERGFQIVRLLEGWPALEGQTYASLGRDLLVLLQVEPVLADLDRLLRLAPAHRWAVDGADDFAPAAGLRRVEHYAGPQVSAQENAP